MSKLNTKLAGLLAKLQSRLNRVGLQASQTASALAIVKDAAYVRTENLAAETMDLRTDMREVNDRIDAFLTLGDTNLRADTVAEIIGLRTAIGDVHERVEKLNEKITVVAGANNEVKHQNDMREARQTLRDQNNVQALVNLRNSTEKAFKQVEDDVLKLDSKDHKLSDRITEIEKFQADLVERAKNLVRMPAPAQSMPSDHVWVNKKLTGVYETTTDLENRVKKLEEENTKLKSLPLAVRTFGVDTFMGHDVKFLNDQLHVGQEVFPFVEDITNVSHQRGQLFIICRGGDIYALAGGPNVSTMFLYQHSRA